MLPVVGVAVAPDQVVLDKLTELIRASLVQRGVHLGGPVPDDPATGWVEAGKKWYYYLEFHRAATETERAVAYFHENPRALGDGESLVSAHLYAALANLALQLREAADEHFRQMLILRPTRELSSAEFSPVVIRAFEEAKATLRSRGGAVSLAVGSKPAFARVYLDAVSIGVTPLTHDRVPVGRHVLRLEKDGYVAVHRWIEVTQGASMTVELETSPQARRRGEVTDAIQRGAGEDLRTLTQSLAQESRAQSVIIAAVAALPNAFLLSMSRVATARVATRAHAVLDGDLSDAPERVSALVQEVLSGSSADPTGDPRAAAFLDYDEAWLGLSPKNVSDFQIAVGSLPHGERLDLGTQATLPETGSFWSSPWLWTGVAAVVVTGGIIALVALQADDAPSNRFIVRLELLQ